ncbi:hypothetical protein V3C33_16615 [Micrococcaceae bacterium Sec5.7]
MKTKTALVLSIAGLLVAGSAALAVNTQTLNSSPAGTTGNSNEVLLPQDSATGTATPSPSASPKSTASPTPSPTGTDDDRRGRDEDDDRMATPSPTDTASPSPSHEPGDDQGGHGGNEARHDHSHGDD